MAYTPDEAYDSPAREVQGKIEIYLDGEGAAPLVLLRDNYLVSFKILEEASSSNTVFSGASSNELTVQLHSPDGMFNPINTLSPYAGKMKQGVVVVPSFRVGSSDWKSVGRFYVTNWTGSLARQTASIVANDCLYDLFDNKEDAVKMAPVRSMSVASFWRALLKPFKLSPEVDPSLVMPIPIAFTRSDIATVIKHLNSAFLTICNVSHAGTVKVCRVDTAQAIRATLTAEQQVIEADATVSSQNTYDAATLKYCIPTVSEEQTILDKTGVELTQAVTTLDYQLTARPLMSLKTISVVNKKAAVIIENASCTSETIKLQISGAGALSDPLHIKATGHVVEASSYTKGEAGKNTLQIVSDYVQTVEHADKLYKLLESYVQSSLPTLQVKTRGNPNLEIGCKLHVVYTAKNIDFTGILFKQTLEYNGGLSSSLLLIDAALLEVSK